MLSKIISLYWSLKNHSLYLVKKMNIFQNISIGSNDVPLDTNIILLIMIRWNSFERRDFLRNMLRNKSNLKHHFKIVFVFNWHPDATDKELLRLNHENEKHKDILLPMIQDNYHNQVLLILAGFEWIYNLNLENLKSIVKMNDDFIVNMTMLDEKVESLSSENQICYYMYVMKIQLIGILIQNGKKILKLNLDEIGLYPS